MRKVIPILLAVIVVAYLIFSFLQNEHVAKTLPRANESASLNDASGWQTCDNTRAGYTFKFPKGWYVYGDGATNEFRVLIGTTSCEGFGLTVSNSSPSGPAPAQSEGVYIRTDPKREIANTPYVETVLASEKPSGIPATDEQILEAWAATTTLHWLQVGSVRFLEIQSPDNSQILAGIVNDRFYSIASYPAIDPATFDAIVSTFSFVNYTSAH